VKELRALNHRIGGLMRAHLVSTLAQHDLDPKARAFAEFILRQEEEADRKQAPATNALTVDDSR